MTGFAITVDQNKYLPEGGREVHAVVTVEAGGTATGLTGPAPVSGAPAPAGSAAEVIIIDTSGSMDVPRTKLSSAKKAAQKAVDTIRDGVYFAVVAGSHEAMMVFPRKRTMALANDETRRDAKYAIRDCVALGGTAMGTWLRMAGELLSHHPHAIRHAILLTDGENEHESSEQLDQTLAALDGKFVCDCRGVGTQWNPSELRRIASAMLGSLLDVPRPEDLEADFEQMTRTAMGKTVADLSLRVWTPQGATLRFVKQVMPSVEDLTARRTSVGPLVGDYPTGSWGKESRDYHICVEVPAGGMGREMRAAWVKLVTPGSDQVLASGNVLAEWTDDEAKSTQINHRVAHYTGQEQLAVDIQEGLAAYQEGDVDTATARLGRALALAREAGHEETIALLGKVIEDDPETGTAQLRKRVKRADEISLETRSTRTIRTRQKSGE
jgi:von Willebrand factor type A C-terminal domain/von Willebrand factor type A domain